MKDIGHYLFIALGAVCICFSVYYLFTTQNYFQHIVGIILGIGAIKISLDKMKLQKEVETNKD